MQTCKTGKLGKKKVTFHKTKSGILDFSLFERKGERSKEVE